MFPIFATLFIAAAGPADAQAPEAAKPAEQIAPASTAAPTTPVATPAVDAPATATTPAVPAPGSEAPTPTVPTPGGPKADVGTGSSMVPHDLSPYGMFMGADVVVKGVMVGLAFASLVTWTILLAKMIELMAARKGATSALAQVAAAPTLGDAAASLKNRKAPVARFVLAALAEEERSAGLPAEGVKERATALLARIEGRASRAMGRGTGLLATIGSTAPFVGLFGTVWGIMNSFIGISKTNTTNLAVVAPGIAEALLATATGLVAAIPAVIIFNMFARGITGYRQVLGDASTEVLRLLSRDLDRGDAAGGDSRYRQAGRQAAE